MNETSAALIDAVWAHGRAMPEADPAHWRQDACGAWMRREHFGREDSEFGWKMERVSVDGKASAVNLRPFNIRNGYDVANGRVHRRLAADRSSVPAEKYARPPRNRAVN
jgi:hypothetical protein